MEIHRTLVERLSARLRDLQRVGERHTWSVDVGGGTRVNIVLDLPAGLGKPRIWVFDPRHDGDSAREFPVDHLDQVDPVVAQVVELVENGKMRGRAGPSATSPAVKAKPPLS